jgi:hypothetical protein
MCFEKISANQHLLFFWQLQYKFMHKLALKRIRFNLRVLSKLQAGQRLSVNNFIVNIAQQSIWQGFMRTVEGESRQATVNFIQYEVNNAIEIGSLLAELREKDDKYGVQLKKLVAALEAALPALENISRTYSNDMTTQYSLMTISSIASKFIAAVS